MNLFIALAPIVILIFLMTKRHSTPSHIALPFAALLVYAAKLAHFGDDPNLVNATVVKGLLTAWTPILIIWGAIFLFMTMERSGGMDRVRAWLNGISANPVAQMMIIGWAFSFLIEGASGFGTPAALATPILVGLGFPPLRAAILCLIMNSVPVSFGAVGTPTWFGFGPLGLAEAELLRVGLNTAVVHAAASLIIPVIALRFVVGWGTIRANLAFVYLSVLACLAPYLALATVNYEFPSLVGGLIGTVASILFARLGVGLERETRAAPEPRAAGLIKATFPLWGTVLVLMITRIERLGIKGFLTDATPVVEATVGSFAHFGASASLVLRLDRIFDAESAWVMQVLYIPALVPFFAVSLATLWLYRMPAASGRAIARASYERMRRPIITLSSALVMVQLLMVGGDRSMVVLIGTSFAGMAGESWIHCAAFLGAVGAFFSGSATISNLTFGGIQNSIATALRLDAAAVLALQSVGGAMGNMVCINNIVAVCSILGIANQEGYILKRTLIPMTIYGLIAALAAFIL